nr:hypothetical protein BaRGS_026432 [Batillaria attramentaria]
MNVVLNHPIQSTRGIIYKCKMAMMVIIAVQQITIVNRLMKVSCGGLIGLSVVAVLIVALSVVVFFYPKKVNRVAPTLEESSAANLHRHVTNS